MEKSNRKEWQKQKKFQKTQTPVFLIEFPRLCQAGIMHSFFGVESFPFLYGNKTNLQNA